MELKLSFKMDRAEVALVKAAISEKKLIVSNLNNIKDYIGSSIDDSCFKFGVSQFKAKNKYQQVLFSLHVLDTIEYELTIELDQLVTAAYIEMELSLWKQYAPLLDSVAGLIKNIMAQTPKYTEVMEKYKFLTEGMDITHSKTGE